MPEPTQASILRLYHAQTIAAACPQIRFTEIALTGSSARGIANDESDIEINFWIEALPDREGRSNWLKALGVENIIAHTEPRPDGSIWVNGSYQGIELEAGWQTFADLEASLKELIEARTTDHKQLRLAELILSAKSLRGSGTLNYWQPILQNYPPTLADKLITEALTGWFTESWFTARNIYPETRRDDLHRVYRILFALNKRWEINWKWAYRSLSELEISPKNLSETLSAMEDDTLKPISRRSGLEERRGVRTETLLSLILETLKLLDPSFPQRDTGIAICQHLLDMG
jgi:hypothetical protein